MHRLSFNVTAASLFAAAALSAAAIAECPADLDGDGVVGPTDLAQLLGAWGPDAGPADLDGDGKVNASDLAMMLGAWGDCPVDGPEIFAVFPPEGGPGDQIQIIGQFPSDDPFDYCVVIAPPGPGPQQFAPVKVLELIDPGDGKQIMRAELGPQHFDGAGLLQVVVGDGQPIGIPNPFQNLLVILRGLSHWQTWAFHPRT